MKGIVPELIFYVVSITIGLKQVFMKNIQSNIGQIVTRLNVREELRYTCTKIPNK